MKEVRCPHCGHINEYDPEQSDVILCDKCDNLIFIEDETNK